ncbi:putative Protein kti12 [Diplocarpon rosae]|nr:putative Protein kti12 [Diplocarpon rosae]
MPLLILTGYPTSGKTHRAKQLHSYLSTHISSLPPTSPTSNLRVHLISDHSLRIPRTVYNLSSRAAHERSNNASEKDARATIYAAVKRVLSDKDIVILDGANYIKGWRYQLYCEAKAVRTPHCVVHVGTGVERARETNAARRARGDGGEEADEASLPYEKECWENLVYRYEEPNAFARWDSPLFTVLWEDELPPCEAIWRALVGSENEVKVVRPNLATVLKAPSTEDYLYELDKATQGIVHQVLEWAKDHPGEGGGEVSVGEEGEELVVELPSHPIGLPALQRLRRQFIAFNRKDAVPRERIKAGFVGYLNDTFAAE